MSLRNLNKLLERQGSRSHSQAGFSTTEGGRANLKLLATYEQLYPALTEVLESAIPERGGIKRRLPAAHPQYQWLFAERIANIEGLRFNAKQETGEGEAELGVVLEAEAIQYYAEYTHYEVNIEFTPRPYPVLSDAAIPNKLQETYYEDGTSQERRYREEWLRYCEMRLEPSYEYLTAENGQMIFKMDNNNALDMKDKAVPGGRIRYLVPSHRLLFKWYCVPYSFITSKFSFINQGIGTVNQYEWNGYDAGHLLLEGVNVDRVYTPAFPQWDNSPRTGGFVPTQQKLCDLTFNMLLRKVPIAAAYTVDPLTPWKIAAGHNLFLNAVDGKYYYTENAVTGRPLYPSFAFQLLWANPDEIAAVVP